MQHLSQTYYVFVYLMVYIAFESMITLGKQQQQQQRTTKKLNKMN